MGPEQAVGDLDRLGPRSDVYGLGTTLYCLLTGELPFKGDAGEVLRSPPEFRLLLMDLAIPSDPIAQFAL